MTTTDTPTTKNAGLEALERALGVEKANLAHVSANLKFSERELEVRRETVQHWGSAVDSRKRKIREIEAAIKKAYGAKAVPVDQK